MKQTFPDAAEELVSRKDSIFVGNEVWVLGREHGDWQGRDVIIRTRRENFPLDLYL